MPAVRYLVLLTLVLSVHGDYVLVVRVDGYVNPTNRGVTRGPNNCCDNSNRNTCSGSRRCDNRFSFCLKSPGNTDDGTSTCMSPVLTSTQTNTNGAPIDFTQPTWLGLDNPLMLNGINTAWEGVQLYIEVNDVDGSNRQLVDVWRLLGTPTSLPVGAALSTPANFTGIYDYATLTLGFQIVCAEFYYGTVCENLNECLSQSINCNQGVCVDGDGAGTCTCNPGYTGQFCESIDYCLNVNCSGNGQCENLVNSFRCNCAPGFTGDLCDLTDHCEGVNCSGNGDCINELSTYSCNCTPGYTGRDCETDIDDCVGVTCNGRGNCTDLVNDYLCTCDPGYTDRDCETDINECVGQNCSGNGQCFDFVGMFQCTCQPGFTGTVCEVDVDECQNQTCSGNGQCVDGVVTFSCTCNPGYTGGLCEFEINECETRNINCSGNDQCVDEVNSYSCSCDPGYTGGLCETNVDDCVGVNCSGNGQCLNRENNFTCLCQPGFTGDLCNEAESEGVSAAVIGASVGGVGGGMVVLIGIILLFVLVVLFLKRRGKGEDYIETKTNIVYGASNREDQEDNLYTYVTTGSPLERIEMNEVYALKEGSASGEDPLTTYDYVSPSTIHGGHGPERIVLKENEVYGLSHEVEEHFEMRSNEVYVSS